MKTRPGLFALLLAAAAAGPAITAGASTFTVDNVSGSTFRIRRSGEGTNGIETVCFRTVGLSAYAGQHFASTNGAVTFAAGEPEKTVAVTELNPSVAAYKYQIGDSRSYRFEVMTQGGAFLAFADRSRNVGSSISPTDIFAQKSVLVFTEPRTVTDAGFGKNGYAEVPIGSYFSSAAPQEYLSLVGAQLRMGVDLQAAESDDGYQHIQILVDETSSCDTDNSDGTTGTIAYSHYLACFSHDESGKDASYKNYSFPVTSVGDWVCSKNDRLYPWSSTGELRGQRIRSNCRAADGRIVIPVDLNTLGIRFDASGSGNDNWYVRNVYANIQAYDTASPNLLNSSTDGMAVNPGPHCKGNYFYISVPFGEIVYLYGGTRRLDTTWGGADYLSGEGSNVLTFRGTINADVGTELKVTNYVGTVSDIANESFWGSMTKTFSGVVVEVPAWDGTGIEEDPYVITTADQLDMLAARVNSGTRYADTYFKLGADIAYPHTSAWYEASTENNYTPIGDTDHSFNGVFDGNGHVVRGIRIYRTGNGSDATHLALFGNIAPRGSSNEPGLVQRVNLVDARITGHFKCGAILGNCDRFRLHANYYRNVSVNGSTVGVGLGGSGEVSGARSVHALALEDGIYVANGESTTIDNAVYYAAGTDVTLSYRGTPPAGSVLSSYRVNGASFCGATFPMAAADTSVAAVFAAEWEGDGTSGSPYVIATADQLDLLALRVGSGNSYSNKYFKLDSDIAYDSGKLNPYGGNYTPIGRYGNGYSLSFSGVFDGCGHTVSGVRVGRVEGSTTPYRFQGLFGYVRNGVVRNVVLADGVIDGNHIVGGIVGNLVGTGNAVAMVSNCRVESSVTLRAGQEDCGGVVGHNSRGTVSGCFSAAKIVHNGNDLCRHAGGVLGSGDTSTNIGSVQDCLFLGGVVARGSSLGAIAGFGNNTIFTNNHYSVCAVGGTNNATNVGCGDGGDCDGARHAREIALGAAFAPAGEGTAYDVSGITAFGENMLRYANGATNNLYAQEGQTVSFAYVGDPVPELYRLVVAYNDGTEHVLEPEDGVYSFVVPAADVTVVSRFVQDFEGIWGTGNGSEVQPYVITNATGLVFLSREVNRGVSYSNKYFRLGANIDMSGVADFVPIGSRDNPFRGSLGGYSVYGPNKAIIGLSIDGASDAGLFGCISGGSVTDLTLDSANVTGGNCVGGIVGLLVDNATVSRCFAVNSSIASSTAGLGGAVVGVASNSTVKSSYYSGCTVNGRADEVGIGEAFETQGGGSDGLVSELFAVFVGQGAIADNGVYNYDGIGYHREGDSVSLDHTDDPPDGFAAPFYGYSVDGVPHDYRNLTMPASNVCVTARWATIEWGGLQAMIDAANGATIVLDRDYAASCYDATLTVTNAVTLDLAGHSITAIGNGQVFRISESGNLTLTNSVPASGAIVGGRGDKGGGVFVYRGTFTMAGGTISGNTATVSKTECGGGGVFVLAGGTFTMTGGTISGNTSGEKGGGVYMGSNSAFAMSGGTVTGNASGLGGGVYVDYYDTFAVSGCPVVSGNTNSVGEASNVYLTLSAGDTAKISVTNLSRDASVGVTPSFWPTLDRPRTIAVGAMEGDEACFFCDDSDYMVKLNGDDNTLQLVYIAPEVFRNPQGVEIGNYAVVEWLTDNGFSQADIDALGDDAAATARLYDCYLANCDFRDKAAGARLSLSAISVSNGVVSVSVELVRKSPLGAIKGALRFYGTDDLADGFGNSPLDGESVELVDGYVSFLTSATSGSLTQTATASIRNAKAKFFKAAIMFYNSDNIVQ